MGKWGIENREHFILKNTSWLFWIKRSQLQGTERIGITTNTPQKQNFFDCDPGGGHEACVCGQKVKNHYAWRDKSRVLAYFGFFKILMRGKNQWIDLSMNFQKFQVFSRDKEGRYQTSSYQELRVSISRWNIKKALAGLSEDQYSNPGNKIDNFTIQNVFTTKKIGS